MRGVEGKEGKHRFGFSYILLAVAIVTYLCTWGYSVFAADWKAKTDVPQIDPILKIINGLRQYQQVNATFPQTLLKRSSPPSSAPWNAPAPAPTCSMRTRCGSATQDFCPATWPATCASRPTTSSTRRCRRNRTRACCGHSPAGSVRPHGRRSGSGCSRPRGASTATRCRRTGR